MPTRALGAVHVAVSSSDPRSAENEHVGCREIRPRVYARSPKLSLHRGGANRAAPIPRRSVPHQMLDRGTVASAPQNHAAKVRDRTRDRTHRTPSPVRLRGRRGALANPGQAGARAGAGKREMPLRIGLVSRIRSRVPTRTRTCRRNFKVSSSDCRIRAGGDPLGWGRSHGAVAGDHRNWCPRADARECSR
jgi:hypothetical protein